MMIPFASNVFAATSCDEMSPCTIRVPRKRNVEGECKLSRERGNSFSLVFPCIQIYIIKIGERDLIVEVAQVRSYSNIRTYLEVVVV